ncbi:hypothetical protein EV715DRAFT_285933 [Schizophyllum commune]
MTSEPSNPSRASNTSCCLPTCLAHPTLQWIDLWEPQLDKNYTGDTKLLGLPNLSETPLFQEVNTEHCPSLRGMRSLDHGLFHMWDLPRLLKPYAAPPLGEYTAWEYPGVCVKQSANRVWRGDLERVHVDGRIDAEESESEGERDEDEDDGDEESEDEDDEDEDGEDEEDGDGDDEDAEDGAGSDDDVNIGKGANVDEEDAVQSASITSKRSEFLLSYSTMDEDDSDEAEAQDDEDETVCDDGEDADEDDDASTDSDEESSDEDDDSVFHPDSSSYSDSDSVHSSDTEGDVEEQVSDNEEIPQLMHDEALAIFRRWPRLGVD